MATDASAETRVPPSRRRTAKLRRSVAGWVFVSPAVLIIGVFVLIPIVMAAWVSVSNWSGRGSPLSAEFVGVTNYESFLTGTGLAAKDFGTAIRNTAYYFLFVVPVQTVVSLGLAILVNRRALKGKGFFRTAFYFPSVTSTVAITALWTFLFSASGAVNAALAKLSVTGPTWFNDPRGLFYVLFGQTQPVGGPSTPRFLGISVWDWLSGPSIAMCAFMLMAVFTTSGTYMLLFLAALQAIGEETEEAALIDGATARQRLRHVTVPLLRPTVFTVVTLGTIGTWQVFEQMYVSGHGNPGKTTLSAAYLAYQSAFIDQRWGRGAATSFVLFAIIVVFTIILRTVLGNADPTAEKRRFRKASRR
jgi:multiple sugar transport system permease protein